MKNILLIGLGRFGKHIAMQLNEMGHEIMAVDINEERVNRILPFVTNAQIGDSTDASFLESLGIGNFDICFVTIGGSFQNSLETTSLLKELGANLVISRAERDVQEKFRLYEGECLENMYRASGSLQQVIQENSWSEFSKIITKCFLPISPVI